MEQEIETKIEVIFYYFLENMASQIIGQKVHFW